MPEVKSAMGNIYFARPNYDTPHFEWQILNEQKEAFLARGEAVIADAICASSCLCLPLPDMKQSVLPSHLGLKRKNTRELGVSRELDFTLLRTTD